MIGFIVDNLATILLSAVIFGLFIGIIVKLVRDRRKGKSSCGCDCGHCSLSDCRHRKQ